MTKARDDLPVECVRSVLDYDPATGVLVWKSRQDRIGRWNTERVGKIAGTINDRGYIVVAINGKDFRAHRLAWAIVTGEWPEAEIDHRNMIKSDNRWDNLRPSTHSQNNQNKTAQSNNTSGYKGVSFCKVSRTWSARMKVGTRYKFLGRYSTPEEAHARYVEAAQEHRGEFANAGSRRP
jgi:hypothetical protein